MSYCVSVFYEHILTSYHIFQHRQQVTENKPLVIPLIGNTLTSAALASLQNLRNTIEGIEDATAAAATVPNAQSLPSAPATLEQQAAQEILSSVLDAQEALAAGDPMSSLVLPLTADQLPLDGAVESTMNDYDSIPIANFGLAMLRGMGWKDEEKAAGTANKVDGPVLRPRGMGLGADKMIRPKALLVQPAKGEVLALQKGACVRMLSGKQKDLYGVVS